MSHMHMFDLAAGPGRAARIECCALAVGEDTDQEQLLRSHVEDSSTRRGYRFLGVAPQQIQQRLKLHQPNADSPAAAVLDMAWRHRPHDRACVHVYTCSR